VRLAYTPTARIVWEGHKKPSTEGYLNGLVEQMKMMLSLLCVIIGSGRSIFIILYLRPSRISINKRFLEINIFSNLLYFYVFLVRDFWDTISYLYLSLKRKSLLFNSLIISKIISTKSSAIFFFKNLLKSSFPVIIWIYLYTRYIINFRRLFSFNMLLYTTSII